MYLYDTERTHDDGFGTRSPHDYALRRQEGSPLSRQAKSWIDLCVGTDLHILALDLDFMEFHLRWLLSTKQLIARIFQRIEGGPPVGRTYFYELLLPGESLRVAHQQALETSGVQVVPVVALSHADGYAKAIQQIGSRSAEAIGRIQPVAAPIA